MRFAPRSAITKGKLGGMNFMYNPTSISDTQSATYSELATPGMSYPEYIYSGGNSRVITFSIYLNDKVESGVTQRFINHLQTYLPNRNIYFSKPSDIRFAFGLFVVDCKLESLQVDITKYSPTLVPIEATLTVSLKVIQ